MKSDLHMLVESLGFRLGLELVLQLVLLGRLELVSRNDTRWLQQASFSHEKRAETNLKVLE
jgi:hypothetical protein